MLDHQPEHLGLQCPLCGVGEKRRGPGPVALLRKVEFIFLGPCSGLEPKGIKVQPLFGASADRHLLDAVPTGAGPSEGRLIQR